MGAHEGWPYGGAGEGIEERFDLFHGGRVAGDVTGRQAGMSGGLGWDGKTS